MENYILVSFWMGAITVFLKLGLMAVSDFPRTEVVTLGRTVAEAILCIGFTVWAGFLLLGG